MDGLTHMFDEGIILCKNKSNRTVYRIGGMEYGTI